MTFLICGFFAFCAMSAWIAHKDQVNTRRWTKEARDEVFGKK